MREWKSRFRRGLVTILTLAVAGGMVSSVSWMSVEDISVKSDSLVRIALEDIEDVVRGEVAVSQEPSKDVTYSPDGKGLKASDAAIYKALKTHIEKVARGEETKTEFIVQTGQSQSKLAQVDVNTIVSYLLNDCPFDLYWHDKTKTQENGKEVDGVYCKYYDDGKIVFGFKVSAVYRNTPDDLYTVTTAYRDIVKVAQQKAQSIVDTNQNGTDYEKLLNYRNAICNLVYYDEAALLDSIYGNSYQVISVFDDDMYSNVVCEGYAKAFKYLCDLSSFDHDVKCYIVSGVSDAGAGAGEHMWNVVTVGGTNGESYLVDVTNCDSGTIGEETQLFMTDNLSGSVDAGYTFNNGWSAITYQYNAESREVYGTQILSLNNAGNDEEAKLYIKESNASEPEPFSDEPEPLSDDVTVINESDEDSGELEVQSEEVKIENTTEPDAGFTFGDEKTIDAVYGGDSFIKTILGYDGSSKVTYTSSDPTVATVTKRGKVSILGAGTTEITAEGAGGEKDSYTLNVSPKKLEWDISGLYAINRQDKIGSDNRATLYGEIKLEGILPNDKDRNSQFSFDGDEYLTGTYEDNVAGRQRVILKWKEGKEVHLTKSGKAANYEMPETLPEFYGTITMLRRLNLELPETSDSEDAIEYKLEMEDGISEVPESLQGDRELNTPLKIVNKLKEDLKDQGIPEENIAVYDVSLSWLDRSSIDKEGEGSWYKVSDEKFPEDGLTITLPYPSGMPRGVNVVISHMFTEDMYTSWVGDIEHPDVIEENPDGIKFTVYGLSPIAIGWSTEGEGAFSGEARDGDTADEIQSPNTLPPSGDTGNQNNQNNTDRSPVTGDTLQILIYAVLVALCAATLKGIQALRRTKKKR